MAFDPDAFLREFDPDAFLAAAPAAPRKTVERRCSRCRQPGHRVQTCQLRTEAIVKSLGLDEEDADDQPAAAAPEPPPPPPASFDPDDRLALIWERAERRRPEAERSAPPVRRNPDPVKRSDEPVNDPAPAVMTWPAELAELTKKELLELGGPPPADLYQSTDSRTDVQEAPPATAAVVEKLGPDEPASAAVVATRKSMKRLRGGRVRGKTMNQQAGLKVDRLSRAELLERDLSVYPEDVARPREREDCKMMGRPCPFVSCAHHIFLDVDPATGSIKLNFPHLEVWEMAETCSLDVADRGGVTLEEVGAILNLTRERIRQVEVCGMSKIKRQTGIELGIAPDGPLSPLEQAQSV